MKINKSKDQKIINDSLLNITPIKEINQNSKTNSIFKFRNDEEDSELYSSKNDDKDFRDDTFTMSEEDIETKIQKKMEKIKNTVQENKKELESVNKFLRTSMQKKSTNKFSRPPISNMGTNINQNNTSTFNNNRNEESKNELSQVKKIDENNIKKIQSKAKKLELLKRRKKEYLELIEIQMKRRELEMKTIEEQINKQNMKYSKLYDGESVSNTNSIVSDLNPNIQIENGLELLKFIFKNNLSFKKLNFLELFINYSKNKKEEKPNAGPTPVRTSKKRRTQKMMSKKGTMREKDKKEIEKEKEKEKKEQEIEEIDEYSFNEDHDQYDDTFIKLNHFKEMDKPVDKSQLVEYDLFYKEQFFKNEVFKYDVENIQDKEEKEIDKEMNKLDCKRRLTEKKKLKEVNDLKGLDTTELEAQIKVLTKEYEKIKKVEEPKVELELNNTEKLLQKGRILGFYFNEGSKRDFPHFSMNGPKEMGAQEIIDFKVLRKEEQARRFFDYSCCLEERKKINKIMVYLRFWCRFFVENPIFDGLSLIVIIVNTILILISDPTDQNNWGNITDSYFLYFYTVESVLKIIAFRFWSGEEAYIKDSWNILDFFVVVVGWILLIVEKALNGTKITGLAGLRAFRILRPLKTVKRFKGLKKLVMALLLSLGHLGETGIVLFFFFLIFAIAGRQMWQGLFYRRCMSVNYGYLYTFQKDKQMCSFDTDCTYLETYGDRYICAKGYKNPDMGAFNFDNVLTGFVTIFMMATLEGWSDIFTYVSKTFKDKIYINPIIIFAYFHFFIFLSSFYMLKLFLAVTNAEYEHIEVSRRELTEKKSFFKLIQSKYDAKMKEKLEKKEKERQLKANNSKKSDEALRDLYYKVADEAFEINKNRRNIPILYSTVKDMYIMTNNNPEEIYLQTLRIDDEETFLGKDIKRQQKEIDKLIDEKVKEMKNSAKIKKKQGKVEEEEEEEKKKDEENARKPAKRLITKKFNNNKNSKNKKIKKQKVKKLEAILPEIKKRIKTIKPE